MENKTITPIRNENTKPAMPDSKSENTEQTNLNSNTTDNNNTQSDNTNKDIPQGDIEGDNLTIEEKQQYYSTYDPRGSTLYNEAIADDVPDDPNVQLCEHYKFKDKEIEEGGNF